MTSRTASEVNEAVAMCVFECACVCLCGGGVCVCGGVVVVLYGLAGCVIDEGIEVFALIM